MHTLPHDPSPTSPRPGARAIADTVIPDDRPSAAPDTWGDAPATLVDLHTIEEAFTEEDEPADREGRLLGGAYRLLIPIGTGSTGAVYEARHEPSGALVAVKVLRERWRNSQGQQKRFEREAHAGSMIRHEHIVRLLDAGVEPDGTAWQVLERLHGRELATALDERPLGIEETLVVAQQLLAALDAVHRRGYVHRDVKPENVFVVDTPDGGLFVKLLDFGIAKPLVTTLSAPSLTAEGVILGTPHYMSPEQISGDLPVTPASDLWALGAVLFTALTGRPPFDERQLSTLLVRIARDPAPSVMQFRGDVPRRLAEVIAKALRTHPAHRYRDAEAMGDDVDRCIADLGSLSGF